ncbi:MAG: excinuclease ABC subunit B [Candidatus Terrybacteria bacterium RIFCSPLOWO2_01_FULL_58_14]|uniref:UvrABC system protein B n=1 Tax=Candidatus Terrybacteria bacterium RIFCSPLOWO2_01_FULL_58_14 TaxID=1802369 RepID=A0A1G2PW84_9BACT|nr:MAG: excinuclease ABC subunit B [Candidatus Terrybacteria bacterium RIFCSPLOWO2_01_FULL_58_14]
MPFRLDAPFSPTGDQPQAIEALVKGLEAGLRFQTLLGVTGSGKTFALANVIARQQQPTLVFSHNKTLAAQLYEELKRFFPDNAVHYFVSYYDYYQPEAYIPQSDTYIEKDVKINEELDRLRHATTQAVLSRNDVIVVASVSAIYNIGSPDNYARLSLALAPGQKISRRALLSHLTDLQYTRNDVEQLQGTFRVRGGDIEIVSPSGDAIFRVSLGHDRVEAITQRGAGLEDPERTVLQARLFPAKFWLTTRDVIPLAMANIEAELAGRLSELKRGKHLLEAQRLQQRTREDLAMMRETGYCHGIENYSRHLEFRDPDSPPFTLIDYFRKAYGEKQWLAFIDESHQTLPQVRGMVLGDRARKDVLVAYGFRLPSARDNRPLTFAEVLERTGQIVFSSATPGSYEHRVSRRVTHDSRPTTNNTSGDTRRRSSVVGRKSETAPGFVEQLIRPTGLLDPTIEVRPSKGQLPHILAEIRKRTAKGQRTLVTTLTKRLAEELASWLADQGIRVEYLHADVKTLERPEILHRLRAGEVDVVVGINLLREGLDLPEVSLVAILDADQEGFLRNETTLIQVMGRAARHADGHVILFADVVTRSMRAAIQETNRRRDIQKQWNRAHGVTPRSIIKSVERSTLIGPHPEEAVSAGATTNPRLLGELRREMQEAVKRLDFERAAKIRDAIEKFKTPPRSP